MSIQIVNQIEESDLDPKNKPYQPINGLLELFHYAGDEILLSGGAGVGKTTACLNKCFMLAEQYPGCRILFLRKTRESMTQSMLEPFENNVVPEGHPCLAGPKRDQRKEYVFPNKSSIVVGGLQQSNKNNVQKVMGPNYDFIYVSEAIELSLEEWEKAKSRLRNFKAPYQQLMADTNPSSPTHWLKKRCDDGLCKMVNVYLQDNARMFDQASQQWTDEGSFYLNNILDKFSGVTRERLLYGKWVQAEGSIYSDWDRRTHVVPAFEIPKDWKRIRAIDFGFNDPFVCLYFAQDPDNKRLYVYREYVRTKGLVEDHAARILELEDGEHISATICDHDAEDRATLERYLKCTTTAADKRKDKKYGISRVQARLRASSDGKPGLLVMDSVIGTFDTNMSDRKLPIGLVNEIDGYVWNTNKDKPCDGNDHSLDALLYGVLWFDEGSPIWIPPTPIIKPQVIPHFKRDRGGFANLPQFNRGNQNPFAR